MKEEKNVTEKAKLNIWLDDERPMVDPDMDLHCRTAEEVIDLIKQNKVAFVSLDNDLGIGYTQGKKVAQFIEQAFGNGEIEFVDFHPHTANPVAFDEIMHCKRNVHKLLQSDKNAQVSDTTEDHSSNADGVQKILSDFGKRISGEAKSKTPLTEEAFKEELEKQYPLQGMKPNRFRQQGANWSFTNYIQPLLSELAEAKKEIERLKSQLDGILKQEFGE
jgi:hypothetical protein